MVSIVVGVDGSPASAAALRWALAEAALRRSPVQACHAWLPPPGGAADEAGLESAARAVLRDAVAGTPAAPVLVRGMASSVLLDAARHADLLVVGMAGHVGLVTRHVVTHAACAVVVVPG